MTYQKPEYAVSPQTYLKVRISERSRIRPVGPAENLGFGPAPKQCRIHHSDGGVSEPFWPPASPGPIWAVSGPPREGSLGTARSGRPTRPRDRPTTIKMIEIIKKMIVDADDDDHDHDDDDDHDCR